MQSLEPFVLLLIALPAAAAAEDALERFSRSEIHMGVEFEVVLYANDSANADDALTKAMARIAALDKRLSDYDLDSELSNLSDTSANRDDQSASAPVIKLSDD